MFQPNCLKKSTGTSSYLKEFARFNQTGQRRSKTPNLKSNTPKKNSKKKINQENQQEKKHANIFSNEEHTMCQTGQIQIPEIKCKECEKYQQKVRQLSDKLTQNAQTLQQLKLQFDELKLQYQRKYKKYKAKNRLQNDQIKLFKWILIQRKDFQQIIDLIEKNKLKNIKKGQKIQQKKDQQQQQQRQQRQYMKNQKEEKLKNQQVVTQPGTQRQSILKQNSFVPQFSCQKEMQIKKQQYKDNQIVLLQKIDILQQKLFQLSMKNEFLERTKNKQSTGINQLSRAISFNNQFIEIQRQRNNDNKLFFIEQSLKNCKQANHMDCENSQFYLQYQQKLKNQFDLNKQKDRQQNLLRQITNKKTDQMRYLGHIQRQNCRDNVKKDRIYEIQSRYLSPIKKDLQKNFISNSSRKYSYLDRPNSLQLQIDKHNQNVQSRSRYLDYIKQREKLILY